ncbi:beta-glucosidase 22-like isoform X1 [Ananas comosus]|uniref:Beta-glucosidase 22-like isoform X1 n=2 Tax=Ananas comosus TaxID=4615 RepID=A0A6P5GHG1_ANACO|nr:beta-glucosidase 22-like isoform X1 [Ananas comosus]
MKRSSGALLLLLQLVLFSLQEVGLSLHIGEVDFSKDQFPQDFVFGAGTSAYQVEGAANEDGRSPSIWDTFTHAGGMPDNSTGDVASDGYHKYKEDVKLMAETGLEAYRFSISWSRLIPNGRGDVNPKGVEYYNNVIDELVKHGIEPHVSLYHLDLPQILEDEYGGWLSPKIVDDFTAYADVCFKEFGDRVRHWTTLVEPNVIGMACYDTGIWPPNRCSYPFGLLNCSIGDSTVEPYIAVHNLLLAHASAVELYRTKYQAVQNGLIGVNVYTFWCYPFSNSTADKEATKRTIDFNVGWILNPLVFGDYPKVMKTNAGSRIPSFTKAQSKKLQGSFDFIGINHYTSVFVVDTSNGTGEGPRDFMADMFSALTVSRNATPGQFDPNKRIVDPDGLQHMLEYFKDVYGNPPVYIQENGYGYKNETLHDTPRIDFLSSFMKSTLNAIRNGANVRGYFVWSFIDVFEFLSGYEAPCGLYHVDFQDEDRKRRPKLSAKWYSDFLRNNGTNFLKTPSPHTTSRAEQ